MDIYRPISDKYDDLFEGEPNHTGFSPPPQGAGNRDANSEDVGWAMFDQADAEGERQQQSNRSQIAQPRQPMNRSSSARTQPQDDTNDAWAMFDEAVAEYEDLRPVPRSPVATLQRRGSTDAFDHHDHSALWQSANDSVKYYDDDGVPYSFDATTRYPRDGSPTETELVEKDFEFHNQMSEQAIIRKFNKKHFRNALRNVDPGLPRKVQWRAWKAAQDERLFLGDEDNDESEISDGDSHEHYEDDIWPCHDGGRAAGVARRHISASSQKIESADSNRSQSADVESVISDSARSSIMRSKPYLSEIAPTETQGHHPSTIPRSPQGKPSCASSLAGSIALDTADMPEPQPTTKEALSATENANSTELEIFRDVPPPAKTEPLHPLPSICRLPSPFKKPSDPASFTAPGQSSLLRKPIDLTDVKSTRAMRGSPVRLPDPLSRPDTPRPSFAGESARESIEQGLPVSPWTNNRSPAQAARSHSSFPVSVGATIAVSTDLADSPTPVKVDRTISSATAGRLPSFQADRASGDIKGRQPPVRPLNDHLSMPQPQSSIMNQPSTFQRPKSSRGGPAAAGAWSNFTQTLRSISAATSPVNIEPRLPQAMSQVQELSQKSTEQTTTCALAIPQPELQKQPVRLLDPWQETPRAADDLVDHKPSPRTLTPPNHPGSQPLSRTQSQSTPERGSDPFAAQSDSILISMPDSPPPEPLPGIAEALRGAKRGQRSARNTKGTCGVARSVTGTRAVSTKTKSPARRTVTGKGQIAARVRGDNVKVGKTRSTTRTTSRKVTNTGKMARTTSDEPEIPPLPEPEQMDIDEDTERDLPLLELERGETLVAELDVPVQLTATHARKSPRKKTRPEDPITPSRTTKRQTQKTEGHLTPQSASNDTIPRRRSPRLLERDEAEAAVTAVDGTPDSKMDVDTPTSTPSKSRNARKNDTKPKTPSRQSTRKATPSRRTQERVHKTPTRRTPKKDKTGRFGTEIQDSPHADAEVER